MGMVLQIWTETGTCESWTTHAHTCPFIFTSLSHKHSHHHHPKPPSHTAQTQTLPHLKGLRMARCRLRAITPYHSRPARNTNWLTAPSNLQPISSWSLCGCLILGIADDRINTMESTKSMEVLGAPTCTEGGEGTHEACAMCAQAAAIGTNHFCPTHPHVRADAHSPGQDG